MSIEIRDSNFVNIQYWMVKDLKLTGNELLVYAIIWGFSQDGKSTFAGGIGYLEKFTGAARNTIRKILKQLEEKGYIAREHADRDGIQCDKYRTVPAENRGVKNEGGQKLTPSEIDPEGGQIGAFSDTPLYKEKNKVYKEETRSQIFFDGSVSKPTGTLDYLLSLGVIRQVAEDYIELRKSKRAKLTKTAIDRLLSEANKAGFSLNDILTTCCANGWTGFRAEWLRQHGKPISRFDQNMSQIDSARQLIFGGTA